jgi:hypothetical protein
VPLGANLPISSSYPRTENIIIAIVFLIRKGSTVRKIIRKLFYIDPACTLTVRGDGRERRRVDRNFKNFKIRYDHFLSMNPSILVLIAQTPWRSQMTSHRKLSIDSSSFWDD